jgi:hypothetical protein
MLLPFLAAFQLAAITPPVVVEGRTYSGLARQTSVTLPRRDTTIAVDGRLDEPAWQTAARLTGFSLYSPVDGRPAPDSTDVLVWYSSDAMYFGIRAYADPSTVAATLADRDRISMDDNVEIHLDTFHERNRAFVFIVNPFGIQADGIRSEGAGGMMGGSTDLSADFIWQSRGRVTESGFEVEVRIPFRVLRYPSGSSPQTWGIQIDRRVQRSGYEETWTPAVRASTSFIAQSGTLTGLTGMHHGQVVELNPELTNTTIGAAPPGTAAAARDWQYRSNQRLGGNVRWTLGSNFVLNGTVKPDFSQVEADATQIAADERFALSYAERRPFFVEALDQFNVPNSLVYTRTIVQPDVATKLTGKVGRADVALLSALDRAASGSNGAHPRVDILRVRQQFGEQSQAGLLYSERVGAGRANRIIGADTKLVFGRIYYAQFQTVGSQTTIGGVSKTAPMWEAVVDATGRAFGFHYNLLGIAPDFRADNGFVPRTGIVKPGINHRFTWYGKPGAVAERYQIFLQLSSLWQYDDFFAAKPVLEDGVSFQNTLTLRGGWNVSVSPKIGSYAFDPADYRNYSNFTPSDRITTGGASVSVSTPQFKRFAASAGTTLANDVDFLETSPIRRFDYNASLDLRPNDRLRMSATYQTSQFTRRATDERSAFSRIPRLKAEYQLARPIFVRVVSQYTATRREALRDPRTGSVILLANGSASVPTQSNVLRTDWLFSYRPTPGTVFFLGYGGSMSEEDPLAFQRLRRTSDALFIKGSYLFRLQ